MYRKPQRLHKKVTRTNKRIHQSFRKQMPTKKHHFCFYTTATNHLDRIVIMMKCGFYMTVGEDQLSDWTEKKLLKHFPRPSFHQPRSWSLFGGLLLVWPTIAFWIPAKPLHLRSMLSKLMRRTENCSACSQHRSTQRVQFFCTTTLDCTSQNHCFKRWTNWVKKFCLTCHIQLTSCRFFKHHDKFLQGKFFHNQ